MKRKRKIKWRTLSFQLLEAGFVCSDATDLVC